MRPDKQKRAYYTSWWSRVFPPPELKARFMKQDCTRKAWTCYFQTKNRREALAALKKVVKDAEVRFCFSVPFIRKKKGLPREEESPT